MTISRKKKILLPLIQPNAGIEGRYRAALDSMLRECRNDVLALIDKHWVHAPVVIAQDAIGDWVAHAIDILLIEWLNKLNSLAPTMAEKFVKSSAQNYDTRLSSVLKRKGMTVNFSMSDYTRDALRAAMGENVGLIRSIPSKYLTDVSKYVWESVSGGFDLATLTDNLEHAYHISRNRAKLIANDQAGKAHAVIEQARRMELGIKKAIWFHSGASKKPRQSHKNAHGKEFDIDKGMYIDGEYILPAQKINCKCGSRAIIDY